MENKEEVGVEPNIDEVKKGVKMLALNSILGEKWATELYPEFNKDYMLQLSTFLQTERKTKIIYPDPGFVFNAYKLTPLDEVCIVMVGQDPYINEGEAHGLSFSVRKGIRTPPSLQVIFKAIEEQMYNGLKIDQDTNLERWSKQGIFLINSVLTVEKGKSASHVGKGWEKFTDRTIRILNDQDRKICFMLFGKDAKAKCKLVDPDKHLVITAEHPVVSSYRDRPWEHNDCFKVASEFIETNYKKKIIW